MISTTRESDEISRSLDLIGGSNVEILLKDQVVQISSPFKDISRVEKDSLPFNNSPGRYIGINIKRPFTVDNPFLNYCIVNGENKDLLVDNSFDYYLRVFQYGNSESLNIAWGSTEYEQLSIKYIDTTDFFSKITNKTNRERLISLFENFKTALHDYDSQYNILNGKNFEFSNDEIVRYLDRGVKDLNKGTPQTRYDIFNFPDEGLLTDAAIIFSLTSKGMLQLRNQLSYSDAGLSVGIFDKTMAYQQWGSFLLQMYLRDKADFKTSVIPRSANSGFFGIGSEFSYPGGRW